jgi:hypothetical protein
MPTNFAVNDPKEVKDNPFVLIGKDGMLVTAGRPDSFNNHDRSWEASACYGERTSASA